jgi:rod shape determining protein RodA
LSIPIIAAGSQPWSPSPLYYVKRQIIWIGLGVVTVFVISAIPYEKFKRVAPVFYWGAIALLLYVLVHGHTALGGQRWINVGPFQLQPSEFAKIAIIVSLARLLDRKESMTRWRDLVSPLVHVALPTLLILKQPDLGTTLVFVAISLGMLFMAGVPWWRLVILYGGGLALVVVWIYLHLHPGVIGLHHVPIPMHRYQLQRLLIFLHPNQDPTGAGYNVIQSRIAIGSGGLFGSGLSLNHATQFSYLPESYTDFIYAVVGQEVGFVGSVMVLFIYLLLIGRAAYIAARARDRFGMLLAAGVASLIAFHVLESTGMASGVMPVAGVPLPFLSYGGSAFLADSAGIGLVINVYMRRHVGTGTNTTASVYSDTTVAEAKRVGGW